MSALFADAQQWSGSTTTADTIYRYGLMQIRPTANGEHFVQIKNSEIRVIESFGTQYPLHTLKLTPYELNLDQLVPTDRSSTSIMRGTFMFRNCGESGCQAKIFRLFSDGTLSTNGKIECTDTILASTLKAISGNFTGIIKGNQITINGATSDNTYKLAVNSGILCEELKVMADVPSSDFVFEPTYKLKPLSEVEAYVTENKHLPDVPSAKEFKENGYKVGEMDNLLLQKIEELTLYIIDLQKQIEELKK